MGCSHVNETYRIETKTCDGTLFFPPAGGGRNPQETPCTFSGEVDVTYCTCDDIGNWTCPECDTEHEDERHGGE